MKNYIIFLLLCMGSSIYANPVEFVVLVTSYNNEAYVQRNLDMIFCQKSTLPFKTIYVNDGSTDRTAELVQKYAEDHNLGEDQLLIINNEVNLGSGGGNIYNTVHKYIDDHKVVVCVDGDDFLAFPGVLDLLERVYADPDVWMTYGRFIVYPEGDFWSICGGYSEEVIQNRTFREDYNVPSHLKTFRAKLYKQIKKEDLCDEHGQFYNKAWDMAMLFPMLEMCAPWDDNKPNHSRYIDTVLYIYNFANPIGDYRNSGGRQEQIQLDLLIRDKRPYEPLDTLFEKEDGQ